MAPLRDTDAGPVFVGSVDAEADVAAASTVAAACPSFSADEEDECYIEGDAPNCFNCRGRRWVPDGFTCLRGGLRR